eukprot:TRINITY_DN93245_c0_g1_i1.p1 TRINITY_DN93245_c0_g1~~TRINITY_DN93245_c0_g1_i1.p1  ORF type:complete len:272 (-),score=59.35 TRINITY_DN93245_c0_g1_i1:87-863(-)
MAQTGYVASVLNEMYGGSLPRAASQLLRDQAKKRSSSAPPQRWLGGSGDLPKQRRHVKLEVPRVGRGGGAMAAKPPPMPTFSRRPLAQILADTGNYKRQDEPAELKRDYSSEKTRLQDRYAFNFGSALPNSGAPPGMPQPSQSSDSRRRVTFHSLPPSREGSPRTGTSGLTTEQERMAADIVQGVRARQKELENVEEALVNCSSKAESSGQTVDRRRVLMKEMASASKKRLELRNAIDKDIKDLEKLVDMDGSSHENG